MKSFLAQFRRAKQKSQYVNPGRPQDRKRYIAWAGFAKGQRKERTLRQKIVCRPILAYGKVYKHTAI
jgi:hypothetical protein